VTRDVDDLRALLLRIDSRGYKAYKEIAGGWRYPDFVLHVDHVQGDPYAAPTRVRVLIEPDVVRLESGAHRGTARCLGTAAFLARAFSTRARDSSTSRGTGRSGEIAMEHPGQKVMPQTAVMVDAEGGVEARFTVGLPADGRRVKGKAAVELMAVDVPELVRSALLAESHDATDIERHASANEDASALRDALGPHDLIAFLADGASLPRRTGIDDLPLPADETVPFRAPDSLRVEIDLPNDGRISGMGVGPGVTLIVGGGFHGKSTVLRALEAGVFNHRPGDGRELVVTRDDAVKIRAEDGRSVAGVDISGFIDGLPFGRATKSFSSPNASGSTSQAAAIVEALEVGSRLLLVDEDTSATNFMIRDRRMQELVPAEAEPITPFVDRIRDLHHDAGVSCVLVIGGSGDYLDVADRVVSMADYSPADVTAAARAVAERLPTGRAPDRSETPEPPTPRVLTKGTLDPRMRQRATYVKVPDDRTLLFGRETIDLVGVEQIANRAQIRAIGRALVLVAELLRDKGLELPEALDAVACSVASGGLDALDDRLVGDLAAFRRYELAATLNRLRSLCVE
jgi:predicted ABC-class ATPase